MWMSRMLFAGIALSTLALAETPRSESVDQRFTAIYGAEWKWRDEQIPDGEDSQKPVQDHLQHGGDDSRCARRPEYEHRPVVIVGAEFAEHPDPH